VLPARRIIAPIAALVGALCILSAAFGQSESQSKYGGVLVFGQSSGQPSGLDPTTEASGPSNEILDTICESMYTTDKKLNVIPQLAASMPTVSPDKRTYTIQLRQGIVFNDGTPFNAQAVVTSYQRYMTLPGSVYTSALSYIDTVTATGPYTVVFHLTQRFEPALLLLTNWIMSPTQLQKLGTNFGSDPICVGPFMYDSQVPGVSVTVIKSPYYYNKYAVYLDKIVFLYIPNTASAAADLEAGDVQVDDRLGPSDIPSVQSTKGLTVISQPALQYRELLINLGNVHGVGSPYSTANNVLAQSPKLRLAFEEAINRNALAKVVAPVAQPGCLVIGPPNPLYDPTIKCTPYNPADAKKLVAASGISNPTVHMVATANSTTTDLVAEFVQSEEQAVGINVVIDFETSPQLNADLVAGNFQTLVDTRGTGIDPGLTFLQLYDSQGAQNYTGFVNPAFDLIVSNLLKATSPQSQKTLVHAANVILQAQRPVISLYYPIQFLAYNTELTGVQAVNGSFYRIAFAQYSS
jgi:peptide/nickel transport system substrate-binding protein